VSNNPNAVTAGNLALGPADLYWANFDITGANEPTDNSVTGAPPSGWNGFGGTNNGVTWTVTPTYKELVVDQIVYDVERRLTNVQLTVATQLAEVTLTNYGATLNSSALVTAATTGAPGTFEPSLANSGATPSYISIMVDGWGPNGKRRRVIVRKCLSTAAVGTADSKDGQKVFPVTWMAHYVSSTRAPYRIIDAPGA
jgi:hypothetical protein